LASRTYQPAAPKPTSSLQAQDRGNSRSELLGFGVRPQSQPKATGYGLQATSYGQRSTSGCQRRRQSPQSALLDDQQDHEAVILSIESVFRVSLTCFALETWSSAPYGWVPPSGETNTKGVIACTCLRCRRCPLQDRPTSNSFDRVVGQLLAATQRPSAPLTERPVVHSP